jgi:hypothetical protein
LSQHVLRLAARGLSNEEIASDTQLAAEIRLVAVLPNGNRIDEVVIHLWTFGEDGKVIALRRVLDTTVNIAADTSSSS